jgi:hypothetical protein
VLWCFLDLDPSAQPLEKYIQPVSVYPPFLLLLQFPFFLGQPLTLGNFTA